MIKRMKRMWKNNVMLNEEKREELEGRDTRGEGVSEWRIRN